MNPSIAERLKPPYKRSQLLYVIQLISGDRYGSMEELRHRYPHLPRPLPLHVLAKEIRDLSEDLMAWEKYNSRLPGAKKREGSVEAIAMAKEMRSQGKTLGEIAKVVKRSRGWVQKNI